MDIYHNVWAEYPLCPRMFFPYTKRHHVPYSPRDFGQIAGLTDDLFREAVATARQRLDIPFTPEEGTYVSPQFGGPHVRDNVPTAHAKEIYYLDKVSLDGLERKVHLLTCSYLMKDASFRIGVAANFDDAIARAKQLQSRWTVSACSYCSVGRAA